MVKTAIRITIEPSLIESVDAFLEKQKTESGIKTSRSAFIEKATSFYLRKRKTELNQNHRATDISIVPTDASQQ